MIHSKKQRHSRIYQHVMADGHVIDFTRMRPSKGELTQGDVVHVYVYEQSFDHRKMPAGRTAWSKK